MPSLGASSTVRSWIRKSLPMTSTPLPCTVLPPKSSVVLSMPWPIRCAPAARVRAGGADRERVGQLERAGAEHDRRRGADRVDLGLQRGAVAACDLDAAPGGDLAAIGGRELRGAAIA